MMTTLPWHLFVMAAIYIIAGLNHFRNPRIYIKIIPPFFPNPKLMNLLAGIAEVVLGVLLCFHATTSVAAWGIIILLAAVFPANVFMVTNEKAGFGLPRWMLLLRLPLQIVLILWAYLYT